MWTNSEQLEQAEWCVVVFLPPSLEFTNRLRLNVSWFLFCCVCVWALKLNLLNTFWLSDRIVGSVPRVVAHLTSIGLCDVIVVP